MPELNLEDHSEEVQQILGQIPKWIIRCGIMVLFCIVLIIFIGSRFIPYPEKTNIPVSITAENAPAPLVAQQASKRIAKWFKMDGEFVKNGELLAVWDADEKYEQILKLEQSLGLSNKTFPMISDTLALPSFQAEIRAYNISLSKYFSVRGSNKHLLEIKIIEAEIDIKKTTIDLLNQQRLVKEREFSFLENQFMQDSIYYHENKYGITKRDYESELLKFLQQK